MKRLIGVVFDSIPSMYLWVLFNWFFALSYVFEAASKSWWYLVAAVFHAMASWFMLRALRLKQIREALLEAEDELQEWLKELREPPYN